MAEVLREYFDQVRATDVFDYGYGDGILDFFGSDFEIASDWIITNPPFKKKAEHFALKAIARARVGVAIFARLQWLETNGRYERLFRNDPPTQIAFFCERVNLCMGRWDPNGGTATAYMWLVWMKGFAPRPPFWIPPGQREALTRAEDVDRYTAHPVKRRANLSVIIRPNTKRYEMVISRSLRRPRIGSDSAHAWARNVTLRNPHAKAVLMAACFYVNDEGSCLCGIGTLAQDTDLSVHTVRNRLNWLERIGAIRRSPRWRDENGRVNYDGRGKRTSDEIRLLLDASMMLSTRRPQAMRRAVNCPIARLQCASVSPISTVGLNSELKMSSPPSGVRQPTDSGKGLDILNIELEVSEAIASDVGASQPTYADDRHELWGEGVLMLESLGVDQRQARSMIGRWLKDTRDDVQHVLGAIQRARDARVIDPIAWNTQPYHRNPQDADMERIGVWRLRTQRDRVCSAVKQPVISSRLRGRSGYPGCLSVRLTAASPIAS